MQLPVIVERLFERFLRGAGATPPELRARVVDWAAALGGTAPGSTGIPPELTPYATKVARHAYRVTDADLTALKAAGWSEDQLFEVTIAAALGASKARLAAGLAALRGER